MQTSTAVEMLHRESSKQLYIKFIFYIVYALGLVVHFGVHTKQYSNLPAVRNTATMQPRKCWQNTAVRSRCTILTGSAVPPMWTSLSVSSPRASNQIFAKVGGGGIDILRDLTLHGRVARDFVLLIYCMVAVAYII